MGTMDRNLLPAFETAFRGEYLRFDYQDAKGRHIRREVEP
ncbi:Uncharacterised protein [Pannonibacter phragmitetus]|uniref:Uncharacterized protein n=1 Tax=Pannonibacter phragmitetus TaxID=121719 RepID=A0A378ZWD5_9HYPH|nr:Uncharacterised protein [Pannonibacter phragmitetus]